MSIKKSDVQSSIKNDVKTTAANYQASVTSKADALKSSTKNAVETKVGQVVGEINGGVESISSLSKDVTGKLNSGAVEGVITDKLTALDGAINDAGEGILSGMSKKTDGIKLALTWSKPDSDGNVRLEQASADVSSQVDESINAVLAKVTGLNVFSGYVQKVAGNVMPKGASSLLEKMKGGIGAFPSVDKLNELTAKANDIADTAKAGIEGAVAGAAAKVALPGGVQADVGKNLAGVAAGSGGNAALGTLGDSITGAVSGSVNEVSNRITTGISINSDKLKTDFAGQTGKLGDAVFDAVKGGVVDKLDKLIEGKTGFNFIATNILGGSKSGVLQAATEKLSNAGNSKILELAPTLDAVERDQIIAWSQGTQEEQDKATDAIAKASGKSVEEIKASLNDLDTTIAGTVLSENEESAFANPFEMESTEKYTNAQSVFTYVSSVEELEAEIAKINREVTEVVVHWTDTYSNKNIGSEELNRTHIELGINGIGYHYVIRRDGSLQRGRPVNVKGDHASENGHDEYSIGLAFVGGINAPSGTDFPTTYRSASSLTLSQMNTFREFCQAFYNRFPGGQILGHNDVDQFEQDPGFDVRDYVEDLFGKKSLFEDPSARGPFSPSELITAKIP